MPPVDPTPPPRRPDLLLRPLGDQGHLVVKDPRTGVTYTLGPAEAFLLKHLDGVHSVKVICQAFEKQFGEPLPSDDLEAFLQLARDEAFLEPRMPAPAPPAREVAAAPATAPPPAVRIPPPPTAPPPPARRPVAPPAPPPPVLLPTPLPPAPARKPLPAPAAGPPAAAQSLLSWRCPLVDPDRLLSWLAPRLGFLWTPAFFWLSLGAIVAAAVVLCANLPALVNYLPSAVTWQSAVLAWAAVCLVTACHEFAHGLTCKRHGGEVHEAGFLLLCGLPCFYCNVSDAWMIRAKRHRIWVSLAGIWSDLCLWAAAVFLWRGTAAGTVPHHVAYVVLTVCAVRLVFNLNPLLKMDGYYLLSDWAEVPNLRQRGLSALGAWVRRLRGGPRPDAQRRGRFVLLFGLACGLFAAAYLAGLVLLLVRYAGSAWVVLAAVAVLFVVYLVYREWFAAAPRAAAGQRVGSRRRAVVWGAVLCGVGAVLVFAQAEEKAAGPFRVYSTRRAEVRAPMSGVVKAVAVDEGGRVEAGGAVASLEVPDLEGRLAGKRSEVAEARAALRLLQAEPRPEALALQEQRVARARGVRDRARADLAREQKAVAAERTRLQEELALLQSDRGQAQGELARARRLIERQALAPVRYREAERHAAQTEARLRQVEAQLREPTLAGGADPEAALALREQDVAEAEAALALVKAGPRPEEVEAARARLTRLQEELSSLERTRERLRLTSPLVGLVATPRLRQFVGRFVREGDVLCEVEDPAGLEVEITLKAADAAAVQVGQAVELRVRGQSAESLKAHVTAIVPAASPSAKGDAPGSVTVICRLEGPSVPLRPGTSGQASIACGTQPVGLMLGRSVLRRLRGE